MLLQAALFVIFTILVYVMEKGFFTIYGAFYLLSLFLAMGVTIRMRATLESAVAPGRRPAPERAG